MAAPKVSSFAFSLRPNCPSWNSRTPPTPTSHRRNNRCQRPTAKKRSPVVRGALLLLPLPARFTTLPTAFGLLRPAQIQVQMTGPESMTPFRAKRFMICQYAVRSAFLFGMFFMSTCTASSQTHLGDGWKVQSSAKVQATGEKVSEPGFPTQGWYATSAPKTVFAVLVENVVYKNPYYGMNLRTFPGVEYKVGTQFANQDMPANSPYAVPWWYRKEFVLPASDKGKRIWMQFRGINYRAEIWINGKKIAGGDEVVGAFRRYDFDVTQFVHPGQSNAVAVAVLPPAANELGVTWVDWNPSPPDKDMGIWQEVVIRTSGSVALRHPMVETRLDLPKAELAHLTVRAYAKSAAREAVKGTLEGRIEGAGLGIDFSQDVELAPNESREITISPESVPGLNLL